MAGCAAQGAGAAEAMDEIGGAASAVTGFGASLEATQNITTRNSDPIVEAIAAEDISKRPDINVEALQCVLRIQVGCDHGEGSSVSMRGLTQVLTTHSIPSASKRVLR